MKNKKDQRAFHLMLAPGMIFLIIFSFIPMFGIVMAFQNYIPAKGISGSSWVGLDNFKFMLQIPDSKQIFANTIVIAVWKIVVGTIVSIVFALLLNEIRVKTAKKFMQTVVYLPNFLSWAILATVVMNIFSYEGPVNAVLGWFGIDPVLFMASNDWFRSMLVFTDVWKGFGYGSIIYLASLTSVDPGLYEAASIDGANRFKQLWYITLPGLMPTILLVTTLNLPNVLNAGFDQIFNLYNPLVYETADIIDTYVYRVGLVERQYSLGTAVGLLRSVVGIILILSANKLAQKLTDYRIF
ncbi:ABC transporter permease [Paenibacillus macquariensis]|uniref:Aldouronate transport system permease protein n=1 Tax=Paenibacillus macquariensis TaxID=948756 RepID=A0ABY1KAQ1_9BACL|nr:ABC transporter permease subunit [Paenibacillus macquariensis]MEC0089453.1 ABC transporter permease subunit [Paenibacillus macquariensis]OAB25865.1 protein lplB [Paenibacillus macquariensis subsp. macquariensis]SIR52254.1 putative aldouronate transport system permease protein [Paenibacillus macquariensis]